MASRWVGVHVAARCHRNALTVRAPPSFHCLFCSGPRFCYQPLRMFDHGASTGLPVPLGTNLRPASCSCRFVCAFLRLNAGRVFLVFDSRHCFCGHTKWDCEACPFPLCGVLWEASWYPYSPLKVLLKQLSAHRVVFFLPALWSLSFFSNYLSSICLFGQNVTFVAKPFKSIDTYFESFHIFHLCGDNLWRVSLGFDEIHRPRGSVIMLHGIHSWNDVRVWLQLRCWAREGIL